MHLVSSSFYCSRCSSSFVLGFFLSVWQFWSAAPPGAQGKVMVVSGASSRVGSSAGGCWVEKEAGG